MSEQEDKARRHGWVPKEDFRGDPDKWRTAEEFNDIGDNLMPVMKERLSKLEEKHDATLTALDKANTGIQKLADHHRGTKQRAQEHAIKTVRAEMRQAVAAGDLEAFDRLQLEAGKIETTTPPEQQPSPDFAPWVEKNQWYNEDPVLAQYADQVGTVVASQVNNDQEYFAEIRKRVAAAYPTHKAFQEEVSEAGHFIPVAPVEGAGMGGSGGEAQGKQTWKDLPPEAQQAYELEFSEIEGFTRDDYAAGYFAEDNQ